MEGEEFEVCFDVIGLSTIFYLNFGLVHQGVEGARGFVVITMGQSFRAITNCHFDTFVSLSIRVEFVATLTKQILGFVDVWGPITSC